MSLLYLQVTILTQFLIDNCCKIFGEDALNIFGDSDEDELSDNQGNQAFWTPTQLIKSVLIYVKTPHRTL